MNIEQRAGEIGGTIVGVAGPEIIYEVSARTVDIRDVLPLRLLLAGIGGTAGHFIVSALHGIIGQHQVADTSEDIPSEVWRSLRPAPPVKKRDDKDK